LSFQEFIEINLQCFWNSALHEAFKNLEYKGSVVPSTIIVGSTIRKHLTILKTAWSRKMLKSPSGYIIDFLGMDVASCFNFIAVKHASTMHIKMICCRHDQKQESLSDNKN